jgi:transposase
LIWYRWNDLRVRDDDGRKLDHATLEAMRLRAVKRIEAGARVEDVASSLGLSRSTVFAWMAAYREGGERALAAKAGPGSAAEALGYTVADAVHADLRL